MSISNKGYIYKEESILQIIIKIFIILTLGSFCLASYPAVVNAAALLVMAAVFYDTLKKLDFFSFLLLVFFSNHHVFGNDKGGLFNIAATLAIIVFGFLRKEKFGNQASSFGKLSTFFIIVLIYAQLLSLMANDKAATPSKITAFIVFFMLVFLIAKLSKVNITNSDFIRFIYVLFFFTLYMLVVAINQKTGILHYNSFLFPIMINTIDFEYSIIRIPGIFLNFEAYAEYSLSIIVLLLPGILSGSFKNESNKLYFTCVLIVFICIAAIILTVTRSSFLLLPLAIIMIFFFQAKRIKISSTLPLLVIIIVGLTLSISFNIIDVSSFAERSQGIDINNLSVKKIASGEDINRGGIFDFAIKKIARSNGLIGEGYFTNSDDYHSVHFDVPNPEIGDYHNLYFSSMVTWGVFGTISFISLFLVALIIGFKVVNTTSNPNLFQRDLLLGFSILFLFFFINQYKIQFTRESNYAMIIFILLIMYKAILKNIQLEPNKSIN